MVAAHTSGVHRAAEVTFDDDLPQEPRSYRSVEMPAVRVADAPGRMLDNAFLEDEVPLVLDLKAPPSGHVQVQTVAGNLPLPAMWARSGSGLHRVDARSADPRPGIVAFAGYGIPPERLMAMPAYALRVLARKYSLRSDLKIARWRSLPKRDIELYEAALACANEAVVAKGLALAVTTLACAVGAFVAAITLLF